MDTDTSTLQSRGNVRIIFTVKFQKDLINAIFGVVAGAYLKFSLATAISMVVGYVAPFILPIAWVPLVGQIIAGAVVGAATFLAVYFYDKYFTSNDPSYNDVYFYVASGWFVPNWDLWL